MKDVINVELDLPDVILTKITGEANDRGITVDELVEVILIDFADNINLRDRRI